MRDAYMSHRKCRFVETKTALGNLSEREHNGGCGMRQLCDDPLWAGDLSLNGAEKIPAMCSNIKKGPRIV